MSEIRHSALLQDLIERAKRVGQRPNPPLTAERFVAAAIMASLEKEEDCQEGPLYDMCLFLWSRLQFPGPIMERILTHIDLARGTLVMDDLCSCTQICKFEEGTLWAPLCRVADFKCITVVFWKTGWAVSC